MSVEPCRECGRLFPFLARGVCAECLAEMEDQLTLVKDWLRKNHAATPGTVADATEVPVERITLWVHQGRLDLAAHDEAHMEDLKRQEELRERLKGDLMRAVANPLPTTKPNEGARIYTRRDGRG